MSVFLDGSDSGVVLYAVALEEGVDCRVLSAETAVKLGRMFCATAGEDVLAEAVGCFFVEDTAFLEISKCIGVEHLGPFVAVVAGSIAA